MEEGLSFPRIRERFALQETDIRTLSPLTLAFIGDAVYSLVVRSIVAGEKNRPPKDFHKDSSELVNAVSQARAAERLQEELTPEEADVYRRGRNAAPNAKAKHASVAEYHKATGLEALIGYLFLENRTERLLELIRLCIKDEKDG